jgi:hypothetical protein
MEIRYYISVAPNLFERGDPFLTFKDFADFYTLIDFDKNITTRKVSNHFKAIFILFITQLLDRQ